MVICSCTSLNMIMKSEWSCALKMAEEGPTSLPASSHDKALPYSSALRKLCTKVCTAGPSGVCKLR